MTDSASDRNIVPIFDGSNFLAWRRRIVNRLIEKDFEDVVGFDPSTLAPSATQPIFKDDDVKNDRKARALMSIVYWIPSLHSSLDVQHRTKPMLPYITIINVKRRQQWSPP